jgi:hypothetical protein
MNRQFIVGAVTNWAIFICLLSINGLRCIFNPVNRFLSIFKRFSFLVSASAALINRQALWLVLVWLRVGFKKNALQVVRHFLYYFSAYLSLGSL